MFLWASWSRKPRSWRLIKQAHIVLSSKGCAKANSYIKDFNFHCLLSFIYITVLDNGAKAEHRCTIVSISAYLTTEAELFVHKLPTQRMCIQVLYSRVTTRAYSTQDVWMLCWIGPWYCLLSTGKTRYYKAASSDCVSQGHVLQNPEKKNQSRNLLVLNPFQKPCPLNYSINIIPFHLKCS